MLYIWRCIQNLMRQNSIKHGQIFNFYYFKKQTHTHAHIYIRNSLTDFSESITSEVFKFCFLYRLGMVFQLTWFRFRVTFGCFCLWMISRNWWGFDNLLGALLSYLYFNNSIKTPFPNRILLREYNQVCYS